MIPYGRQEITPEDMQAVLQACQADHLTQGPLVPRFEQAIAACCGAQHAVAVNSATSALHIACLALDLGPGDWLWTSPITFVASANCALYCGARVDFVDIDPQTYNLSIDALEAKLQAAEQSGRLPKVLVPVHMCGQPCDMQAIARLGRRYGFRIIEDAAHALGARYQASPVGACAHSDITVFSFHPVKNITTGEGGVATTNDALLAQRMQDLRSHGITRDPQAMTHAPDGPWYYQQLALGFNYRMTELQAALGLSQLTRLHAYVAKRNEIADRYDQQLRGLPLSRPVRAADAYSACHLYIVTLDKTADPQHRLNVYLRLRAMGIGVNVHYIPVHTQPFYQRMGFAPDDFPQAQDYYQRALTLPLFPTLQPQDLQTVVHALHEVLA